MRGDLEEHQEKDLERGVKEQLENIWKGCGEGSGRQYGGGYEWGSVGESERGSGKRSGT